MSPYIAVILSMCVCISLTVQEPLNTKAGATRQRRVTRNILGELEMMNALAERMNWVGHGLNMSLYGK